MTREEARAFINALDDDSIVSTLCLKPSHKAGANMYCCPVCGSGEGRKGTGAFKVANGRGKCYSGKECFTEKGEDYLGICRTVWQCSEDEVFTRVIGPDWKDKLSSFKAKPKKTEAEKEAEQFEKKKALAKWTEQTKRYISNAAEAIKGSNVAMEYLEGRGINTASIARFSIGYDASKEMIVLPYNMAFTYYEGRYIAPRGSKTHGFPEHAYNGIKLNIAKQIFNVGALQYGNDTPVFVVESIICAISIMQTVPGTLAVAIGGTSGVGALVEQITNRKAEGVTYILCLDNDDAGQEAQGKLKNRLSEIGAKYVEYNIAGEYKDPNEALINDREGAFKDRIGVALDLANQKKEEEKIAYLQANSNREYLLSFIRKTRENTQRPWIPTGITDIDKMLDPGLYPGLIIIGAVSSLGKTTLAMQIMDNIAKSGRDVLIFSLEMDREELISKSVSRHTFFKAVNLPGKWEDNIRVAKTCRGISDGSKYANYSKKELNLIADSMADYGRYANNVFIFEGVGNIGVFEIRQQVEEHIRITGNKPVVLVDYMQILAPYKDPENPNRSFTDKQIMDKNVLELKRISRDYTLPVIAISSLNRASYNETMSMAAFKESGSIEYSADILLGLEYANIKTEKDLEAAIEKNAKKNAAGDPTEVRVRVLKNRSGARGATCILNYYPMFNAFLGQDEEPEDTPETEQQEFADVTDDIDVPF